MTVYELINMFHNLDEYTVIEINFPDEIGFYCSVYDVPEEVRDLYVESFSIDSYDPINLVVVKLCINTY